MDPSIGEKFDRLRENFTVPSKISGVELVEIRRAGDEAVLLIRVESTPWRYGIAVDLADTSREFYYDDPVESFDDWLTGFPTYLMVALDTGVFYWAERVDRGDYIALHLAPAWPSDRRHQLTSAWPVDDPTSGLEEDNGLGRIATATAHVGPGDWWASPAVSGVVLVSLFRSAMVRASLRGSHEFTTTCDAPELECLGFVWDGDLRRADTRLVAVDREAAESIHRAGLERPLPRYRRRGFIVVDHDAPDADEGFVVGG